MTLATKMQFRAFWQSLQEDSRQRRVAMFYEAWKDVAALCAGLAVGDLKYARDIATRCIPGHLRSAVMYWGIERDLQRWLDGGDVR